MISISKLANASKLLKGGEERWKYGGKRHERKNGR